MSLLTHIQSTRTDLGGRRSNDEHVTRADASVFNALLGQVKEKTTDDPVLSVLEPIQPEDRVTYGDLLSWYTQMFAAVPRQRAGSISLR